MFLAGASLLGEPEKVLSLGPAPALGSPAQFNKVKQQQQQTARQLSMRQPAVKKFSAKSFEIIIFATFFVTFFQNLKMTLFFLPQLCLLAKQVFYLSRHVNQILLESG